MGRRARRHQVGRPRRRVRGGRAPDLPSRRHARSPLAACAQPRQPRCRRRGAGSCPKVDTMSAMTSPTTDLTAELESYRRELTAYCYRMLGGTFQAEDAVQETMLRAWRAADSFEGRSSLRSWLYRIATNVCLDMIDADKRRVRPMDLRPAQSGVGGAPAARGGRRGVGPSLAAVVGGGGGSPATVALARESVRLA